MTTSTYSALLSKHLDFLPNTDQIELLNELEKFIDFGNKEDFFILCGPAGSGKTSLVKALVKHFDSLETDFILTAPTGRAAQILASKTGNTAGTLHSLLFNAKLDENTMQIKFVPKFTPSQENPVFYIVDEASMISDNTNEDGMFLNEISLLSQLIKHVKAGNSRNKIIFIGDKYQLPPVNASYSPALSLSNLKAKYGITGSIHHLGIVERQAAGSYILKNAGTILSAIESKSDQVTLQYIKKSSFSNAIKHFLNEFSLEDINRSVMVANANSQVKCT